ncbi:MAG: efflux transporter outer membrane subunit [Nitrospirota bacterium]
MRKLIAAILLLFALGGCMAGPNYKRPRVDIPGSWRVEEKEAQNTADTAWWELFGDPVLDELIKTAIRENKDLKVASYRVQEFVGQYIVTRSPLFPQLNAGAGAERNRLSERDQQLPLSSLVKNPANIFSASINASWEIDLWGRIRRATEAARADVLSTEEARRGVILTLVTQVAGGYMNLLDLDRQLDIAKQTAKTREEYLRIFNLRFNAGIISDLELSQVRSEYEQAMAAIPAIEKAVTEQENALSVLVGRNPGPIPRGKDIDKLILPPVPEGLPSELLERRPDILQAEQNLIAANARIGAAKALYFPSISLTGQFGFLSTQLSKLFTGPALAWSFAGTALQPIFTGGSIYGQVKAAKAVREETLVQYQEAIQNAFRDVNDALIDQRRTREQLEEQAKQVEALGIYDRVARLRYDNGYTSYIDVLDAERSLFDAEISYTQTRGALFQALINLYKAIGGGWVTIIDKGRTPIVEKH